MMGVIKISPQIVRPSINSALLDSGHSELIAFYQLANTGIPEVVLTEYAARVCYNSAHKMGTVPNFVQNVLQHGHLSVAEHASLAIMTHRFERGKALTDFNRYFTKSGEYGCGNIRSWLELMGQVDYSQIFEIFLACFPPAFDQSEITKEFDPESFPVPQQFSVPSMENVHLLAVNFGSMPKLNNQKRNETKTWGRFTFLVEGISRACSHHIARHRGASISEQSQRYVDATKKVDFTYPPNIDERQRVVLQKHYAFSMAEYTKLRDSGMKKEDARFVLPMAIHTRMVVSFDKKELLHFLKVRCAKDAQWEIRGVAEKMAMQAMLATQQPELVQFVETQFDKKKEVV